MGEAQAAVTIAAPIDLVWLVMVDTAAYPAWNPFIVEVVRSSDRELAVGDKLVLHVRWHPKGGARATERVTALDPPERSRGERALLEYEYGGPVAALGLVRGRRRQELVRLDADTTAYRTVENLRGLMAWAAPLKKVQDGFERHAHALKARAESLA